MNRAVGVSAVLLAAACAACGVRSASEGASPAPDRSLYGTRQPAWYGTAEAVEVAEELAEYQQTTGGWPKISLYIDEFIEDPGGSPRKEATDGWILGSANAIEFLTRVQRAAGTDRFETTILRGIDFLLEAQYPNGGWPKVYPDTGVVEDQHLVISSRNPRGRYSLITFNDHTMARAMNLVLDVARGESGFEFVDGARRRRARAAVEKGTELILRLQLSDNGRRTAWAQQYDERTLEPVWGRMFEPVGLVANETTGIVRFLMRLENPGPAVTEAVQSAVAWLEQVRLTGIREVVDPEPITVEYRVGRTFVRKIPGRHEKTIVRDPAAPPLWARFYEIGTNRPLFASADDTARYSMEGISVERRTGYDWYGDWPRQLLEEEYLAWLKKHGPASERVSHASPTASPPPRPETESMTYAEAVERLKGHTLPDFWQSRLEQVSSRVGALRRGSVRIIATSPGGRPVHLVTYGEREPVSHRANFNSAVAGRDPSQYADRAARQKPVVLFVGPVHGQEVEGLVGLMNLIEVLETGRDLRGRDQSTLRSFADRARILVIPTGNPDGVARFEPGHLNGLTRADIQFWGQGTRADDSLIGWPGAKLRHPMEGADVGYLGSYFNDAGVNPMHDEFFRPLSAEAPAILDVAREEAPDLAVSLHSHLPAPGLHRPSYVPLEIQESALEFNRFYNRLLESRGLPTSPLFRVQPESGDPVPYFNLVSALYHVSGAVAFIHENTHGVREAELSLDRILDVELTLYEAMLRYVLGER